MKITEEGVNHIDIAEALYNYLSTCPALPKEQLYLDFLPSETGTYAVELVPTEPIGKRYLDGSVVEELDFVLASRNPYGNSVSEQMENLKFFETFSSWLEEQNQKKNFPDLGTGKTVRRIETITSGALKSVTEKTARYETKLQLIYTKKGER